MTYNPVDPKQVQQLVDTVCDSYMNDPEDLDRQWLALAAEAALDTWYSLAEARGYETDWPRVLQVVGSTTCGYMVYADVVTQLDTYWFAATDGMFATAYVWGPF